VARSDEEVTWTAAPPRSEGSEWVLAYEGFDPEREGLREALCTLGNGYFATRGAAAESRADEVHYPGTYIAGCWNRLRDEVAGQPVDNESIVNLPNWLPVTIAVEDGDWLDLGRVEVLTQRQELDLRCGVLTRWLRFADPQGRVTAMVQRRFVHMQHSHLAGLETIVTPENWAGVLRIRTGIDGTVQNAGVDRYRKLASDHLRPVTQGPVGPDTMVLSVETSQSRVRIATGSRTQVLLDGERYDVHRQVRTEPRLVEEEMEVPVTAGQEVTVEKVVAMHTGRDWAISEPGEAVVTALARSGGFAELLDSHTLAWAQLWERFHTSLEEDRESGSAASLTVRLYLFHLLQTLSGHTNEVDVGVPARGLHGEAYRGHIFWDELFVLPVLTLRAPTLTRSLLSYRYRRLPAARSAAQDCGLAGALYPWQSGSDGSEVSQLIHLNPLSGRWLPDVSRLQRHAGLAVAFTAWHYFEATGDLTYLQEEGAEMLLEIARYWAALATHDPARGRFVIRGVMGPDEFHTGYPGAEDEGLDNNAYTNVMAVWVLRRALDVLAALPVRRRVELTESLGLRRDEVRLWQRLVREMFVPFHEGVISQFERYEELNELDWEAYRQRYGNIQRLDRILEAEGSSVNGYKASKQPDVLMLFYLLSADELRDLLGDLGYPLEPELIPRTIQYYLRRTSHGSTLSALVHAWVLARAHRDQSVEYFRLLLESDVADVQGGTTAEGIHLAAMAGSVDVLQRCFTGLETRGGVLRFNPQWPEKLGTFTCRLRFRQSDLIVRISSTLLRLSAVSGDAPEIQVFCHDERRTLRPGETVEFDLQPE
jgi:trehalose/maltose hydrolase-like predicted phosphorylase